MPHKYVTIKNLIQFSLLVSLRHSGSAWAAQSCKTEAEIPSSTPSSQFVDNGNGTVSDNKTKLMWAKCSVGQNHSTSSNNCSGSATNINWQGALQAAEASSLATHADWRLPNIKELQSIVELRCVNPSINATVFPDTPASYFWSASPGANDSASAWNVYFYYGDSYYLNRDSNRRVRLVRSGQ